MKKITLEKLLDERRKNMAKAKEIESDIENLQMLIEQGNDCADRAASKGDIDGYSAEIDTVAKLAKEKFVKTRQLETLQAPIDQAIAAEAWRGFQETAEADFKKKYEKYIAAREDLARQFKELIDINAQALQTRVELADLAGVSHDKPSLDAAFPLDMLPVNGTLADRQYFIRIGTMTNEESIHCGMVAGGLV